MDFQFKGGPIENPSYFRPISILPVLSKLFEKPINLQLVKLNSDEPTPTRLNISTNFFLLFINDLLKLPTISRSFAYSDIDVKALESNCNNDLQLIGVNLTICQAITKFKQITLSAS